MTLQRGIQTFPDGTVTNIPQSMVTDQFGMIGLLTFIRAAETDQHLVSLALGADLTSLGLNLNQVTKIKAYDVIFVSTPISGVYFRRRSQNSRRKKLKLKQNFPTTQRTGKF